MIRAALSALTKVEESLLFAQEDVDIESDDGYALKQVWDPTYNAEQAAREQLPNRGN